MDQVLIDDLKQFIQATVSQAVAGLATKEELSQAVADLATRDEMNQRFDDLDLKLATIADAQAESIGDHEQRITTLEQHRAGA